MFDTQLTRGCLATKDGISQAHFVLKTKKAVLPLYEQAFDIEFPLPKLDMCPPTPLR